VSLFDLIAAALIAVSAIMGFQRGAVKELIGLVAFSASAVATLALLPVTVGMAEGVFHPHIIALAVAVVAGFAGVYLALKLLGHLISSQLHDQSLLGGLDSTLGLAIGAGRALVLLGLFALVFDKAVPVEMKPTSVTGGFLYPLASASGRLIGRFAPKTLPGLGAVTPLLADPAEPPPEADVPAKPRPTPAAHPRPAHKGRGYDQHSRDQLDTLVERTR